MSELQTWAEIGGRIGFIQFPGDPPRCGPYIAAQLQQVYHQYVMAFDQTYLNTVVKRGPPNVATMGPMAGPSAPPGGGVMNGTGQPQQQSLGRGNAIASASASLLMGATDPQELSQILQYAKLSAEDLHRRGVAQETINKVERHRDLLLRTLEGQRNFLEGVQQAIVGQGDAPGMPGQLGPNNLMPGGGMAGDANSAHGSVQAMNAKRPGQSSPGGGG